MVFLAALIVYPLIRAFGYSLQNWDGIGVAQWVGLHNYVQIFADPIERGSLVNLGILLIFYSLIPTAVALVTVNLMRRSKIRGAGFFRVVFFLPQAIVTVVVAIVWTWLAAPSGPGHDQRAPAPGRPGQRHRARRGWAASARRCPRSASSPPGWTSGCASCC